MLLLLLMMMILMLMMIKMRDSDECDVGMQMYAGGHLRFLCWRWNQLPFQAFLASEDDDDFELKR